MEEDSIYPSVERKLKRESFSVPAYFQICLQNFLHSKTCRSFIFQANGTLKYYKPIRPEYKHADLQITNLEQIK